MGAGAAQSLSCNVVKHPNRISNDPGRLLPICFDIPSSARLVCAVQINDDSHTKRLLTPSETQREAETWSSVSRGPEIAKTVADLGRTCCSVNAAARHTQSKHFHDSAMTGGAVIFLFIIFCFTVCHCVLITPGSYRLSLPARPCPCSDSPLPSFKLCYPLWQQRSPDSLWFRSRAEDTAAPPRCDGCVGGSRGCGEKGSVWAGSVGLLFNLLPSPHDGAPSF